MHAAGWSDGLPLVPPTRARVERMLSGTARPRDDELGHCPPMYQPVTVEMVAVNAVMAGCAPPHLRIVIAAVEAMLSEQFNLHGVHATTMGATPVVLVNGPAREEAGLNSGHGALGSGSRANASIGRAVKLVLQNVGGAKLGGTESTTLGTPAKFSFCVAEAEEVLAHVGWQPYHVASQGCNGGDSVVTVVASTSGPHQLVDAPTRDARSLLWLLGAHISSAYAPHVPLVNEALVVISPEHAKTLRRGDVSSKAQLANCLWHNANRQLASQLSRTLPLAFKARPKCAAALGVVLALLSMALSLLADCLSWWWPEQWMRFLPLHSLVLDRLLGAPKFDSPASFHIVLAGGRAGKFSSFCPGFGAGRSPNPFAKISQASCRAIDPMPAAASGASAAAFPITADEADVAGVSALVDPTPSSLTTVHASLERPPSLCAGTAIALVDISKTGGAKLLDRLESRMRRECPGIACKRFRKPTFSRPMPASMCDEIARSCSLVVNALAD